MIDELLDDSVLAAHEIAPGLRAVLAAEPVPLWEELERRLGRQVPPPFFGHVWPGSLALIHHLQRVRGLSACSVLDFAAGGGLAGIMAARLGARVLINDVDPLAVEVARVNARLNGVEVSFSGDDLIGTDSGWDMVLVGDVFYEAPLAARLAPWLDALVRRGADVIVGDPGRQFLPRARVELLEELSIRGAPAWDSVTDRPARLWRWRAP